MGYFKLFSRKGGCKLGTLIELAVGQKFTVTMDGKLVHGIVVEDEMACCCDPCMFIEKKEICDRMMCSRLQRKDRTLVHYELEG